MEYRRRRRQAVSANPPETVGYGQTPVHSRFKPGQSGNPRGRPRGSGNSSKYLRASLEKTVPVTIDGKSTRMRRDKAFYESLLRDGLKGDNTARRLLIAEMRRLDEAESEREAAGSSVAVVGPSDSEILEKFRNEVIEDYLKEQRSKVPGGSK